MKSTVSWVWFQFHSNIRRHLLTEQEVVSGQCKLNRTDLKSAEEEGVSQSVLGREFILYLLSSTCYDLKVMVIKRMRKRKRKI